MGRCLAERWPVGAHPPRFLVHRSEPAWLSDNGHDVRRVDLSNVDTVAAAVAECDRLINLLRPDGTQWLLTAVNRFLPAIAETAVTRLIHASTIDVYGATPEKWVDEDCPVHPVGRYEREHHRIEQAVADWGGECCIVRPGAIFGRGGRTW